MRFILLNAIRDRALEARRRANPGKVQRRPMIGGRALPSGARRVLGRDRLTQLVVDQIEAHVSYGNVRFMEFGKKGDVDFAQLRTRLGFLDEKMEELPEPVAAAPAPKPVPAPPVASAPVADDSDKVVTAAVGIMEVTVTAGEDGVLGTEDDEVSIGKPDPEPDLEEVLDPAEPEEPAEDEWVIPAGFADYLGGLKNRELRPVLTMLGESSSGKKKATLVEEILALLADKATDPVAARNAISKAQSFGSGE